MAILPHVITGSANYQAVCHGNSTTCNWLMESANAETDHGPMYVLIQRLRQLVVLRHLFLLCSLSSLRHS
jgi:hypothetical protein